MSTTRYVLNWMVLVALTGTVRVEHAPASNAMSLQPPARRVVQKQWKPQWRRGGKREEDLFALPRDMVASPDGIYLADGGALEILAFDTTGKLKWKAGRKGGGPGEFLELTDITLDAFGNVVLLDSHNGRVTWIGRTGALMRTASTGALGWPSSVCVFANDQLLLTVASSTGYLAFADRKGQRLNEQKFPWPTIPNPPQFLLSSHLARGIARDDCWLATTFGFGLARIASNGRMSTNPFIEQVAAPVIRTVPTTAEKKGGQFLESGDNAALSAFTEGDTLFVFFMGKATSDKPLLDLYDTRGHYIESWPVPDGERVTYSHGILYTLVNGMENPALEAWKAAPTKAPAKH